MTKHLLTKQQREAGLDTFEDDHCVYIKDTMTGKVVVVLGCLTTIEAIQEAASDYLVKRLAE